MKSSHYELEFPISKISDSEEFQGRTEYDDEWIDTLSEQIAKGGQEEPIILWHRNNEYIKLAGFCRTR